MPSLLVASGPHSGLEVSFIGEAAIGREPSCQLVLSNDDRVSRVHARISQSGSGWVLRDLESGNGTWRKGRFGRSRRISGELPLLHGSEFEVGASRVQFILTEGAPLPGSAAAPAPSEPRPTSLRLPLAGLAIGGTFSAFAIALGVTGGKLSCGESEAAAAIRPSTVWLLALDDKGAVVQTGTGFVLREDGYILTNRHVIAGPNDEPLPGFQVVFPGDERDRSAEFVTADPVIDLALLRVRGTVALEAIKWGSASSLQDGDALVAAGFPIPSDPSGRTIGDATFTFGRLSAKRQFQGAEFLQHDAEINPGNSGGPLADICGRVVGVNTQVAYIPGQPSRAPGINFAISASDAKRLSDRWLPLR